MICLSDIELMQKWLIDHNDNELNITAISRYGALVQTREYVIDKYGNDVYNEIITGKRIVKNIRVRFLSCDAKAKPANTSVETKPVSVETVREIEPIKLIGTSKITDEEWEKVVGFIEKAVSPKINELKIISDNMNKGIIEGEIDKIATTIREQIKDDISFEVYMSEVNFELCGMKPDINRYNEIIGEMSKRWLNRR